MKCIIYNQVVLSRVPEGPLAAHIGSLSATVIGQGWIFTDCRTTG